MPQRLGDPQAPSTATARLGGALLVYVLVAAVFALDVTTHLGVSVGMLYVPLVLLAFLVTSPRHVGLVTAVSTVLTLLGAALSPPADVLTPLNIGTNRALAVLAVAACGWFAVTVLRARQRQEQTHRSLLDAQGQVGLQTRLLEIAGEVGRFGGWSVDVAGDRVLWSDEMTRIFGTQEQPDGVDGALAWFVEEDRPRIRAAFELCVRDGTPFDLEAQIRRGDGELRWVNSVARAQRGPDGDVVIVHGAVQDITDRIEAQVAAAAHRRSLEVLADSMPFIIWTAEPDGNLDFVSSEVWRYAGVLSHDVLGEAWLEVVHPDDREPSMAQWSRCVSTGEDYSVHFRLRRADGEYRWHLVRATPERDAGGRIVKWWGSAADVHELRTLEARASSLAERLNDTLESIGDAVLALDRSWRVSFVNHQAELLLDHSRETMTGQVIWDLFPEARGSIFQEQYELAVAEQRPVRFDAPFEPLDMHADISAYPHEQGLTIYFRDISEQRAMAAQLARSQRLEAVGQLTGGIAHDFNNLLTVILGSSEVLASRLEDERLRALAVAIQETAGRGAELTHNLLAFARRQPLAPEAVDVNRLIQDMHDLLSRSLGGGVGVHCELAEGLPSTRVDRAQLENALLNLSLNGRDAMSGSGLLSISTSTVELDEDYAEHHPDVEPGRYVRVAVTDTGPGVPSEHLDRIFEPFFTTKDVGRGSGLGLAMVYGLMKQSLGHVAVRSEPGAGATFELYLPVQPDATAGQDLSGPRDEAAAPEPVPGNGEAVLLVEDDAAVRTVAAAHLAELGYAVTPAAGATAALEVLRSGAPVDLLLTDVVMPGGLQGPELVDRALLEHPALSVLYTSGYTDGADLTGPDGQPVPLLAKPYTRGDLARAVRTALRPTEEVRGR